jgi:apolipoprotein D and lipocalin family protein
MTYFARLAQFSIRAATAYIGLVVSVLAALTACNTTDRVADSNLPVLPTVTQVDVSRYLGTWYQQALIPNKFQAVCVSDTRATYLRDGDGLVVVNQCRRADGLLEKVQGVAKIVEGSNNAKLRVSFFRPFYGDYWVLALDPGYNWVLVGEPKREFGWILSRDNKLDDATVNQILDRAVSLGYDRNAFKRSVQVAGS